ncbi:MAG: PEP/pyruvate-binding domain-containing protein, partial [bacterium]
KMVQSDISGIVFTVHPVTEDPNQMIIEAGYGLGEAIVSGQITPDSYIVSKSEMSIIDINIGVQTRKLVKCKIQKSPPKAGPPLAEKIKNGDDAVSNKWIDLSEGEGGKQKLSGKQIIEVAEVCKKIEDHYGFPCDIEWAIEDGKIYITQSRPITTLKKGK